MDPYNVKNKKEYRRGLPIGTRVVISKARKKGVTVENPFTKVSQRNSYWDRSVVYIIHSRQRVGYPEPFYVYRIKRESDGKLLRARFYQKELFVKANTRINNFYRNKNEYETFLNAQQTELKKWLCERNILSKTFRIILLLHIFIVIYMVLMHLTM